MNLHLDTTQPLVVSLKIGEQTFEKKYARPQEQAVLAFLDETLKKLKLDKEQITSITVNPGPGSFTGTRVGVTIANALAFALNIPVNDQKPPVLPVYDQPPHITQPKLNLDKKGDTMRK